MVVVGREVKCRERGVKNEYKNITVSSLHINKQHYLYKTKHYIDLFFTNKNNDIIHFSMIRFFIFKLLPLILFLISIHRLNHLVILNVSISVFL